MDKNLLFFASYGVANAGLMLYGLLALIMPGILMESFALHVYRFPAEAALASNYLSALFRLLGYLNLIVGILGLFLWWRYRLSRQTWLAYTVVIFSILSYLGPIVFDNTVGHIGFFEIIEHLIFIAMVASGIAILRDKRALHSEGLPCQ